MTNCQMWTWNIKTWNNLSLCRIKVLIQQVLLNLTSPLNQSFQSSEDGWFLKVVLISHTHDISTDFKGGLLTGFAWVRTKEGRAPIGMSENLLYYFSLTVPAAWVNISWWNLEARTGSFATAMLPPQLWSVILRTVDSLIVLFMLLSWSSGLGCWTEGHHTWAGML